MGYSDRTKPRPRVRWQRRPEKRVLLKRDLPELVALAALVGAVLLAIVTVLLR